MERVYRHTNTHLLINTCIHTHTRTHTYVDIHIYTYIHVVLLAYMHRYKQPLTICFFSKLLTLVKSLPRSSDDNWSSTSLIHCSTSSAACINCCCCLTSLNFWPLSFVLYNEHHQWFYWLLNKFIHMIVYKGLYNDSRNY